MRIGLFCAQEQIFRSEFGAVVMVPLDLLAGETFLGVFYSIPLPVCLRLVQYFGEQRAGFGQAPATGRRAYNYVQIIEFVFLRRNK